MECLKLNLQSEQLLIPTSPKTTQHPRPLNLSMGSIQLIPFLHELKHPIEYNFSFVILFHTLVVCLFDAFKVPHDI